MIELTNPWSSVEAKDKTRTSIDVPRTVDIRLHQVYPKKGVLSRTMAILVTKFIEQLDKHGINEYDPERYHECLGGCNIHLGGIPLVNNGPITESLQSNQANQGNVRPRTKRVARKIAKSSGSPKVKVGDQCEIKQEEGVNSP
jgi:hypothetical protein